jgi:hypothetical protein
LHDEVAVSLEGEVMFRRFVLGWCARCLLGLTAFATLLGANEAQAGNYGSSFYYSRPGYSYSQGWQYGNGGYQSYGSYGRSSYGYGNYGNYNRGYSYRPHCR